MLNSSERERERERDKGNTKLTDRQTDSAYAFDMSGGRKPQKLQEFGS